MTEFDLTSDLLASEVMVHGPLAFPIGTTTDGRPFLAGTYYGQGRVIVVTHEVVLGKEVQFEFIDLFKSEICLHKLN